MTSVSLLTLSAFNALEGFLFLKKFRRIVQLLSTVILALRNRLLQHHWVSWRVTSLNSLLELFVDIFPGWIVNLGSCLFFFFLMWTFKKKKVFIEFVTILLLLFYVLVFWLWGIWDLSSLTGIKPSPSVLKVQSLDHWIPIEVPCHAHFWTSQSPQHRAWHTVVVPEKSRKPFTLCVMTFLSPKRWIVSQLF